MINFICAQPDQPLFIWQLKVLLYSLKKLNVPKENIHFLVLLEDNKEPSKEMRQLEKYATIYYYNERPEGRFYSASSKPYLYARHWEEYPELEHQHFLFIESDMLVHSIPILPEDNTWYWSDASKYLEVGKLESKFGEYPILGKAFGFHAFGKGSNSEIWYKVEKLSQDICLSLLIDNPHKLNIWISEMRAWMWVWKAQFSNIIHPQLKFEDGTGISDPTATLYHQLSTRHFYKKQYREKPPFDISLSIPDEFCLSKYLKAIKETANLIW